jgi:MOSC domain-containing protein YiiM
VDHPAPAASGTLIAIHLCVGERAPMRRVEDAEAQTDYGLRGDRHAEPGSDRQVLLIEQEILDDLGVQAGAVRENLTTRGIAYNGIEPGARIRVGSVLLEATGPCRPCSRMDEIRPGLKAALRGRRGTLCRVVEGGKVVPGDRVVVVRDG